MQRLPLPFIPVVVGACLLVGVKVRAQSAGLYFLIGQGFTAAQAAGGMEIGYRMFTVPEMPTLCAAAPAPERLLAPQDHLEITVGELSSFRAVNILAVDAAGQPLPPVPITVELEEEVPGIVAIVDGENYKQTGRTDFVAVCCEAVALQPGTFRVRFRTFCADPGGPQPHSPSYCGDSFSKYCKETIVHYRVKAR